MTPYLGFWYFGGSFWVCFLIFKIIFGIYSKVRQGLFSSFWSYEPPFRQKGGEGEVVTDGRTEEWTDGKTEFPLLDSDQLRWPE